MKLPENKKYDTYEIFQIENIREVKYAFRSLEEANGKINFSDYKLMYSDVLDKNVTLDQLFNKHNEDDRPNSQKMRSMSMSDVVVLKRGEQKQAFYVDFVGFTEVPQFLEQEHKQSIADQLKNGVEQSIKDNGMFPDPPKKVDKER